MTTLDVRGRYVWLELLTTDLPGARAFYGEVLGWSVQPGQNPALVYDLFVGPRGPVAGLMALPDEAQSMGAPPHWLSYVGVPDLDASVAQASAAGARVYVPPLEAPGIGRFAVLADPQGAAFGLSTTTREEREEVDPGLGERSWTELGARDHRAAFAFYADLVGWTQQGAYDLGPMGEYLLYGRGERTYGGLCTRPASLSIPPAWLPYVAVDRVTRVAETTRRLGGQVLHGPAQVPGGSWIVQCQDPQGAAFAAHQRQP